MKNLYLLLLSFLLISCQTVENHPSVETVIHGQIDQDEIYPIVNVYPINGVSIVDQIYDLPTKDFIYNSFLPALKEKLKNKTYKLENWDCDSYSVTAYQLAGELGYGFNNQLAIGEFHYIKDANNRGHAIIFFLYKELNDVKIEFIEPQNGSKVILTKNEINNALHWRI